MGPRLRIPAGEAAFWTIGIRENLYNWQVPKISWFDPKTL